MNAIKYWTKLWDEEGFFVMGVSAVLSLSWLDKLYLVAQIVF